jgi:hypothetical protein
VPDDKEKRDYRDRDRVNVHQEHELRYLTNELGVTRETRSKLSEKVGVLVPNVRQELGK